MRYTRFFAHINKDVGLQRIGKTQLGRILNIVFLEGELKGVEEAIRTSQQRHNDKKQQLLKFKIQKRITTLSGNMEPKALLQEICYLSEKEL